MRRVGRPRLSVATAAVVALASALLLSGCAGEENTASLSGGSSSSGATSGPDGAGEKRDGGDPERSDAEKADGESDAALTGAACLPGKWILDNAKFAALIAAGTGGVVDDVQGLALLTLGADGSTSTRYEDWSHTITSDGATMTVVRNGTDSGTYSLAGGSMTMTETSVASEVVMTMNGNVMGAASHEPSVFSQATFSCSGDTLTVTADGGTSTLHRQG